MTAVRGHLTSLDFPQEYRKWTSCAPVQLYEAPTVKFTSEVNSSSKDNSHKVHHARRTDCYWSKLEKQTQTHGLTLSPMGDLKNHDRNSWLSNGIWSSKRSGRIKSWSGPIVIVKARTLVPRLPRSARRPIHASRSREPDSVLWRQSKNYTIIFISGVWMALSVTHC